MSRFVVIADYPDSPYQIGEIITDKDYPINKLSFPEIFEPIGWWQNLKQEDLKSLPKYIMIDPVIEETPPFHVVKIIKWELVDGNLKATTYEKEEMTHRSLRLYLPSNKIEFAKYIKERNQYTKSENWRQDNTK
jgi:hypothetical protein